MEITVELMEIIDSYWNYLRTKTGQEFKQMQIFAKDKEGKEIPAKVYDTQYIRFS